MIILIGGSSHVGKTLLSQKLIEKYKYPCLSLDHLKMGLIRNKMTELTVNDDLKMRYFLWPLAAEMIKTAIENEQNMIVEGCYIPGEWKQSFTDEYLEKIRCVFIVMSEDYIRKNGQSIARHASVIESRKNDEIDIDRLVMCSKNFKKDCADFGINCLEISESYDIDDIVSRACKMMNI